MSERHVGMDEKEGEHIEEGKGNFGKAEISYGPDSLLYGLNGMAVQREEGAGSMCSRGPFA